MTSYSVYPENFDSYGNLPLVRDGVDEIRAQHHNSLRSAIVQIELELGLQPSGVFATVSDRLDNIADAKAAIDAHIVDPTDAHDATAISLLDTADNYISDNVEGAITELAAVLPTAIDTIGNDNTTITNSGIPDFVTFSGTLFGFNTGGSSPLKKTQPVLVTGIHIIDIGDANGTGDGWISSATAGFIKWKSDGDSFGAEVDVSLLDEGDVVTLSSSDSSKKIRVARTSAALPTSSVTDSLNILKLNAVTGAVSITSTGIQDTNYITRTATDSISSSREQFVISGVIYPADKGTFVLQRKLRTSSDFIAIAVLDLGTNFDEDLRATTQPVYIPTLADYDSITLYDRLPARNDYETLDSDANDDQVYDNLNISTTFSGFQLAKYIIPISNSDLVGGTLEPPTDITAAEMNGKLSVYRLVHYKTGITDFNGEPAAADIFSLSDALGTASDGNNNVRMSNVVVDSDTARPDVLRAVLTAEDPDAEVITKYVSGVNYYNGSSDKFNIEVESNTDLFSNTYLRESILTFGTDVFSFPSGTGFGATVDVTQLFDDGYAVYSDSNLPAFGDNAFYLINGAYNTARQLYPKPNMFSTNAHVISTLHDPFGPGNSFDSYGWNPSPEMSTRILVNSYPLDRASKVVENFTDESFRVGTAETFNFNTEREQFTYDYGINGGGNQLYDWDSSVPILPGDLVVGGLFALPDFHIPGLVYPQSNYSSGVIPYQENVPDYSTDGYVDISTSVYQRLFNLDKVINSGRLRVESDGSNLISFNDLYDQNESRFGKIEVKIPGNSTNSTGWLDVGRLAKTGRFEDGGGALHGTVTGQTGNFIIPFTFQVRNNADAEEMIALRVTYFGSEAAVGKTKILTRLTMLEAE